MKTKKWTAQPEKEIWMFQLLENKGTKAEAWKWHAIECSTGRDSNTIYGIIDARFGRVPLGDRRNLVCATAVLFLDSYRDSKKIAV